MNREEALEIIRNIYQTDEEKEALKALIPELNESEDERIRKRLIEQMERWHEWALENNVVQDIKDSADAITYLEKQKEPHYTKRNALFDKCVEDCDPEVMKSVSDEVDEMLEKEQKPAEWSEEDENRFRNLIYLVERSDEGKGTKEGFVKFINRLKSLRPQPKVEWSEEDEKKLSAVLFSISRYGGEEHLKTKGYKYAEILSWLKSLRPQPKAERSEEDEERIQSILFSIGYCKDEYPNKKDYSKDIDWLKDLPNRFALQPKQEWSEEDEAKKERLISIVKRALHGNEYPILNDNGATELITWLKSLRPQPHKDTKCEPKKGDIVVNKDKKL